MVIPESQKCKVSAKKKGFRRRPNLGLYAWAAMDLLYSYGPPGWRAAFDRLCSFAAGTPDTDFSCHRCSTHISQLDQMRQYLTGEKRTKMAQLDLGVVSELRSYSTTKRIRSRICALTANETNQQAMFLFRYNSQ
ncbi:unnamed protein product [Alternaria sp. RS040]